MRHFNLKSIRVITLFLILLLSRDIYAGIVGDVNNDGKIGLEEAIYALQVISEGRQIIPHPRPADMVFYFGFDEAGDSVAVDLSGHNRNGNVVAASRVDGKIGKALLFGHSAAHVDVMDPGLHENTGYITIEAWIKLDSLDMASIYKIIGGYNYHDYNFQIRNGRLEFIFNNISYILGKQLLTTNAWMHIAVVSDGTNIKTYIDGVEDNSANITMSLRTTTEVDIGATEIMDLSVPGGYRHEDNFSGIIDELKVWNVALTADDILTYYNSTK